MKILKVLIAGFFTAEMVGKLAAWLISLLLRRASKSKQWERVKSIVEKVEEACHLFNECFADDEMIPEEEETVAQTIEGLLGD